MTKQKLNIARLILAVVLVVSLATAVGLVAFAEDAAATAQTREYNATFDRMLDDGSGDGATPAYYAASWGAGEATTPATPAYKIGSAEFVSEKQIDGIAITMRSPDESIKLEDLVIRFRVVDNDQSAMDNSYPLTEDGLDDLTLSGGAADISAEWTTVSTDLAAGATGLAGFEGFHICTEKAGKLDIQSVAVIKNGQTHVVINFDDIANRYWDSSKEHPEQIVPKCYSITDSKQITNETGNLDEAYNAIVLKIKGTGTVTVAPVAENGTVGTAKAWTELTDLESVAVAAIGETYANHVISLASLGSKAIKGVSVAVTGGTVDVAQVFFTNMESRDAEKYFPALDADSVAYMTRFDFEYLNANDDYSASVDKCAEYNLWYVLCYNGNPSAITNGHLVMDANGQDYTGMKIRSKVTSEGRRYLVVKYKLENGATLDNFRFDVLKADPDSGVGVVYVNNMKAAFGLSSLSNSNPYKATSGYEYLVVDLLETYGVTDIAGLDLYYSGEGQLLIDEVFYAHPQVAKAVVAEDNLLAQDLEIVVNDAGEDGPSYQYIVGMDLDGKRHDGVQIVMRGEDAETTLDEIRIELGGKILYFTNNASLALDIYGREMPALTVANQEYTIDFAQSGVTGALDNINIHATTVAGGKKIIVESFKYVDYDLGDLKETGELLAEPKSVTATADNLGYAYIGGLDVPNNDNKQFAVMEMEVEGDITSLRIALGGGTYWFVNNEDGSPKDSGAFKDANGNLFDTTITTKRTLVIDLKQTGVTSSIDTVHIHHSFAAVGDVLTVSSVNFKGYTDMVVSGELLDQPIVKEAGADYYYVGYLPVTSDYIPQKLVLKVTGDLTNVRLGFEGQNKTLWFAENAEGSLYGTDGNLIELTGEGERTIVIDLVKSGLYYPLNGIHVHNGTNPLTISSVVYYSMPVGYETVTFAVNDDSKPVISQTIATTGKVGTEITLNATASDNYDGAVDVTYEVTLNNTAVTVNNGKFTPTAAGTYAVKITATDAAGNVATETVSITVTVAQTTDPGNTDTGHTDPDPTTTEDPTDPDGLSTGAIVGIVLACVAVVCGGVVAFIFIRKKKMGK